MAEDAVENRDESDRERGGRDRRGPRIRMGGGAGGSGPEAAARPVSRSFRSKVARFIAGIGVLAVVAAVGGCAYLTAEKQGELIFRPTKDVWRGYSSDRYAFEEHWIPVATDKRLHAWWLKADDPDAPVVLYLHG